MRASVLLAAIILAGCASPAPPAYPGLVLALGDSITVAVNSAGEGTFPQHSWATGLAPDDGVHSFVERLRALHPEALALNEAKSGARVADVLAQAREAARARPELVLLLVGANDACARPPTPPDTFRQHLRQAADALPSSTDVYALSVPDVTQLARAMEGNETARALWKAFRICPSVLGDEANDASRAQVRQHLEAYNRVIADEAAARGWTTDGGAVFAQAYDAALVSDIDAFHPSLAGQARLAEISWRAGPFS